MNAGHADEVLTFAPQREVDRLPLGAHVTYTARAAVARWRDSDQPNRWVLYEGAGRNENPFRAPEDLFDEGWPQPILATGREHLNKSVIVWPEEGSGIVIGFVRRGIGKSEKGYMSHGGYYGEPEYEPGYFNPKVLVPLYAVKTHLLGLGYLLVPAGHLTVT